MLCVGYFKFVNKSPLSKVMLLALYKHIVSIKRMVMGMLL